MDLKHGRVTIPTDVDIVDKTVLTAVVRIVVLQRDLYIDVILGSLKIQNLFIQRRLAPVQISDIFDDAALVIERLLSGRLSERRFPVLSLRVLGEFGCLVVAERRLHDIADHQLFFLFAAAAVMW